MKVLAGGEARGDGGRSTTLVESFHDKCARMQAVVDFSTEALADAHSRQLARDVATIHALKGDVLALRRALSRLNEDVQPALDRLARGDAHHVLPRPPAEQYIKAPTAAEQAAAALVQRRWRQRRPRFMASHQHCPVLLRRRFIEGASYTVQAVSIVQPLVPLAPPALPPRMEAEPDMAEKHFMSIL